jgi:hypothetical protein
VKKVSLVNEFACANRKLTTAGNWSRRAKRSILVTVSWRTLLEPLAFPQRIRDAGCSCGDGKREETAGVSAKLGKHSLGKHCW